MSKCKTPNLNTDRIHQKTWPEESDFRAISRRAAISLVDAYIGLVGLCGLQGHSHFARLVFDRAAQLDDGDLREGIANAVHYLANRARNGCAERELWKRLESTCGPFDKPAAIKVGMWALVIMPPSA
ncbi:MAG: hypothetical protein WKG03_05440 [Telluria sp.]